MIADISIFGDALRFIQDNPGLLWDKVVEQLELSAAASTVSLSISLTPTYAFVRIGGTASTTSAISTTVKPTGRKTIPTAITASVGSARPTFATLIATNE